MKRLIISCPCGETTLWTEDIDDGKSSFSTQEGVGDNQPCCSLKKPESRDKGDYMWDHYTNGIKKMPKRGRGR